MTDTPPTNHSAITSEELREQLEGTREDLGETVDALAAQADIKHQLSERAGQAKAQAREKAAQVGQLVKDRTPEPIRDTAAEAMLQVRQKTADAGQLAREKAPEPVLEMVDQTVQAARANRKPLVGVAAALAVLLLVRGIRRSR